MKIITVKRGTILYHGTVAAYGSFSELSGPMWFGLDSATAQDYADNFLMKEEEAPGRVLKFRVVKPITKILVVKEPTEEFSGPGYSHATAVVSLCASHNLNGYYTSGRWSEEQLRELALCDPDPYLRLINVEEDLQPDYDIDEHEHGVCYICHDWTLWKCHVCRKDCCPKHWGPPHGNSASPICPRCRYKLKHRMQRQHLWRK